MSLKLKKVGHFSDLSYGDNSQDSLGNARRKLEVDNLELSKITHYLSGGYQVAASPGITRDILSTEHKHIGPAFILSDGVWRWHSDLAYYVENYRVALPEEFLIHMRAVQYQIDTEAVERELEKYDE